IAECAFASTVNAANAGALELRSSDSMKVGVPFALTLHFKARGHIGIGKRIDDVVAHFKRSSSDRGTEPRYDFVRRYLHRRDDLFKNTRCEPTPSGMRHADHIARPIRKEHGQTIRDHDAEHHTTFSRY